MKNRRTSSRLILMIVTVLIITSLCLAGCGLLDSIVPGGSEVDPEQGGQDSSTPGSGGNKPGGGIVETVNPIDTTNKLFTYAGKTAYDRIYNSMTFDGEKPQNIFINFDYGEDKFHLGGLTVRYYTETDKAYVYHKLHIEKEVNVRDFLDGKANFGGLNSSGIEKIPYGKVESDKYRPLMLAALDRAIKVPREDIFMVIGKEVTDEQSGTDRVFKGEIHTKKCNYEITTYVTDAETLEELTQNIIDRKASVATHYVHFDNTIDNTSVDKPYDPEAEEDW